MDYVQGINSGPDIGSPSPFLSRTFSPYDDGNERIFDEDDSARPLTSSNLNSPALDYRPSGSGERKTRLPGEERLIGSVTERLRSHKPDVTTNFPRSMDRVLSNRRLSVQRCRERDEKCLERDDSQ